MVINAIEKEKKVSRTGNMVVKSCNSKFGDHVGLQGKCDTWAKTQ